MIKPLSLEEKSKFIEISQNYKNVVKRIKEEIFPCLDKTSAIVQEMKELIIKELIAGRNFDGPIVAALEFIAYFSLAADGKKEIEEDIISKLPKTPHGEYTCNQCEIRSAYLVEQIAQQIPPIFRYHCELCERTGTKEEILK